MDGPGQIRLGVEEEGGGFPDVLGIGNGDEVAEGGEFHGRILSFFFDYIRNEGDVSIKSR